MFRTGKTGQVMIAEEGIHEDGTMVHDHVYKPGKTDKAGQGNAPVPFQIHNIFKCKVFGKHHPKSDNECGKSKSNGSFCQKSKTAGNVCRDVFFAKKGYKGNGQCENKSRIGNSTSGKNNNLQRSSTYKSTCKGRFFSNQLSCKKIEVRGGTGTDYGRRKSGGKSGNAENRKGNRVKPVKKRRLIIPVFPVNTGGKPFHRRQVRQDL